MKNVIMGFEFNNDDNFNLAKKELDYTMKLNENINNLSPEKALELYNKLIDENIFKTPVGMEFLRKLQKKLFSDKAIDNSKIRNIPAIIYKRELYDSSNDDLENHKNQGNNRNNNLQNDSKADLKSKSNNNLKLNSNNNSKNNLKHNSDEYAKKDLSGKNIKGKNKYRDLYIKMLIINFALIITIVVMFVITKQADKFDEDYYRESVENEYISWQNALEEKEASIAAKENES